MKKDQYVSIPQLAKLLGISRVAVYKKVKKGEIKAIRVGKNFAISRTEVNRLAGLPSPGSLSENEKKQIDKVIKKTIKEYGDVLKKLGSE